MPGLGLIEVSFPCCMIEVKAKARPDLKYSDFQERLRFSVAQQTPYLSKACPFHRDLAERLDKPSNVESIRRILRDHFWGLGSVFLRKATEEAKSDNRDSGWLCDEADYSKMIQEAAVHDLKLVCEERV